MIDPYFLSFRYELYLQRVEKIRYDLKILTASAQFSRSQSLKKLSAQFHYFNDDIIYQVFAYQKYISSWPGWFVSYIPGTNGWSLRYQLGSRLDELQRLASLISNNRVMFFNKLRRATESSTFILKSRAS